MQSYWQELFLTHWLNPQNISLKKYPIYGRPMWVQGTEKKGERWNISNSRTLGQTGKEKIWWGGTSAWRQMHCLPQHQNLAHPPLLGMGSSWKRHPPVACCSKPVIHFKRSLLVCQPPQAGETGGFCFRGDLYELLILMNLLFSSLFMLNKQLRLTRYWRKTSSI